MPIKPENARRYPRDWKQIRAAVLERASNVCEQCGVPNGAFGYREDGSGEFVRVDNRHHMFTPPRARLFRIVLTIAHLDHTPEHCELDNLRAWCQRCHLRYDHEHHMQNARQTRRAGKALADMFPEQT